ncbi:hypothetical protein [Streptomyces sp. NEAU-L66]|uniref:hypothetical protein n=1 Tax=Streptomyces sp. NEAU-L66 TaxID=3390812 RepID=UPI0039C61D92
MGTTGDGAGAGGGAGEADGADGAGAGGAVGTPGRAGETGALGPVWSGRTLLVSMAALLAAVAGRGTGARRTVRLMLTVVGTGFLAAFVLGVCALGAGLLSAV